ncbi:hypothetical protein [Tranquillimonas alkanivorans]|uniref:Uncharacterized protein n=1 Tax=Tranquillimonas alkanivorans TaxID=441119 RepID=A0A1I5KZL5_9RHOB|nr:hypothetical protein [Tranquillimonas alkanivorans]SFO89921.1 hypothetical protein SAMN04488047_101362 [Tranquillimonas alkanivorans]
MNLVRPELRAALWRWRETLSGGAAVLLGLWWVFVTGGLLFWIGLVVAAGGAALAAAGVQRARFRHGGEGPGVVQVIEGQLGYFGPRTGGAVSVDEIEGVEVIDRHWRIYRADQPPLDIPLDAKGNEALFDVLTALPGVSTEDVLRAARNRTGTSRTLWRKERLRLH